MAKGADRDISPPEGHAVDSFVAFPAPRLDAFGIPTPDHLVGLALSYQIAQKVHGATDPHDPPEFVNKRARDVVDLILLKELTEIAQSPSPKEIRAAIEDIFESRAHEAHALGRAARTLPAKVVAYPHWATDYAEAASDASVDMTMDEAIVAVNQWLCDLGVGDSQSSVFSAETSLFRSRHLWLPLH